jgi:hypothetical protein
VPHTSAGQHRRGERLDAQGRSGGEDHAAKQSSVSRAEGHMESGCGEIERLEKPLSIQGVMGQLPCLGDRASQPGIWLGKV